MRDHRDHNAAAIAQAFRRGEKAEAARAAAKNAAAVTRASRIAAAEARALKIRDRADAERENAIIAAIRNAHTEVGTARPSRRSRKRENGLPTSFSDPPEPNMAVREFAETSNS